MAELTFAYIGLGSNLGDRSGFINDTVKKLAETNGIKVNKVSDLLETPPLNGADQPMYLNAVAEIKTTLTAEQLHRRLMEIEISLGRVRKEKWSPRTIDLDLLLFGKDIINYPDLTTPHPQMHLRSFVLNGLCQLDADLMHPTLKVSVNELARRLNGQNFVIDHNRPQLVSIAGIIGVGKTTLTKRLASLFNCPAVYEPYDTNPFISQEYAGKKEVALDSELYFLTQRAEQLNRDKLKAGKLVLSDYIFNKTQIYAKWFLDGAQSDLYKLIHPPFADKVASPILVIYLKDSIENCLQRIRKRNRSYEQKIELQFLQNLDADYEQLFRNWKISPVIHLSMSEFDCMNEGDINYLVNQIKVYAAVQT